MQLIDVDDVHGVRAMVTTFASDAWSLRFVLAPISPLAEPVHYEAVRETLRSCDLVVTGAPRPVGRGRAARARDLVPGRFYERIARGPHIQLSTPPDTWTGVDRPFITAPDAAPSSSPGRRGARESLWLLGLAPFIPLMAAMVSRVATRVEVGQVLATHARQALEPAPAGRGLVSAARRRWESEREPEAGQLAAAVRRVHSERRTQDLRVAVVDWPDILPGAARALGGLGYRPGDGEWITVFPWLPGEAPAPGQPRDWAERLIDKHHTPSPRNPTPRP